MNKHKKNWACGALLLLTASLFALPMSADAAAEKLPVTGNTQVTVEKGVKYKLLVPGTLPDTVWTSSDSSVIKIKKNGKIKAKGKGTAVLTGQTGTATQQLTVTVKQPVTAVRLSSSSLSLKQGKSHTLTAAVSPADADNKKIKWVSSNTDVATVDSKGRVTAVGAGTATITAKTKDGSGLKAKCKVTVTSVKMKLSQASLTIEAGESATLKAKKTGGMAVTWGTSNRSVATVSGGKVTGVSAGDAVIAVRKIDGSQILYCKVKVVEPGTASGSGEDNASTAVPGVQSENARKFLALLQKYSDRVESDYAAGRKWTYANSGVSTTWKSAEKKNPKCNCALLARWGLRDLGIIDSTNFWGLIGGGIEFRGNVKEQLLRYCDIIPVYKTPNQLLKEGNLLPGDICTYVEYQHTNVYAGNGLWYDAGRGVNYGGGAFNSFGPAAAVNMSGTTIGHIIRLR